MDVVSVESKVILSNVHLLVLTAIIYKNAVFKMSDIHNEEGSYLTTDAVPDKPRKNVPEVIISEDKADRSEENKSVPSSPVHTTKPKPRSSPTASNRTSKPKKKPCSSPRSTHGR